MLKTIIDKSGRASGPITVGDVVFRLAQWLVGPAVIAALSTSWDWYWETFDLAGVGLAFMAAWLVLSVGVFW